MASGEVTCASHKSPSTLAGLLDYLLLAGLDFLPEVKSIASKKRRRECVRGRVGESEVGKSSRKTGSGGDGISLLERPSLQNMGHNNTFQLRKKNGKKIHQTGDVEGVADLHDFALKAAGRREGKSEEQIRSIS